MFKHQLDDDTYLQLLETRHAEPLFGLVDSCRPHLREWLPWVDGTQSPKDSESFIKGGLVQFAANQGFHAGIWHRRELAGVIGLHEIRWAHRSTSIGYWLGERFQGRGLMTRSCRALLEHAFGELGLNRVEIRCATGNHRSRAIPDRLGFRHEGTLHDAEWLYDHHVDHAIYSKLARDWELSRSAP